MKKLFGEKFGQISNDAFVKGLVLAMYTAILTVLGGTLLPLLQSGTFPTGPEFVALLLKALAAAAGAGLAYLWKNMTTNSQDQVLKKEPPTLPKEGIN